MPKVSIVLPTFNGETYIRESIDSVLSQTYKDWELIIVDDCSADATCEIIENYKRKDLRIRIIHNKTNQKLPNSLNIGFECATGEYLTWTSDDNCFLPNAVSVMAEYLDHHKKIYMVTGAMETMDENGVTTGKWPPFDDVAMYYYDCLGACFMYRRSVMEEIGGYDPDMFLVEDYDYWLKILIKYGEIGSITDILYRYRNHEDSLTFMREKEIKKQRAELRRKNMDAILEHLKNSKNYLCRLYYDFIEDGDDLKSIRHRFIEMAPELGMDTGYNPLRDSIIYGAGDYGNRAFQKIKGKASYYADRDPSKIGQYKNGKRVISVNEMIRQADKRQIIVAVSNEKIYEVLHFLMENRIGSCCVYQSIR